MNEAIAGILEFGRVPLVAGALVSLLCSLLSVQVVLNRIVFVSAALGQVAALGITMGLFLERDPMWVSLGVTLVAVTYLSLRLDRGHLPAETRLGMIYAVGAAGSILFVVRSAAGHEEVMHLLEGSLLFTSKEVIGPLALATLAVACALGASFRHLVLVGFDPEGAQALGYRVWRWRFLLYFLVGLAVASSTQTVGLLVTFALLVMPGAIALCLAQGLGAATLLAAGVAVGAHGLALLLSYHPGLDLPPGPVMVMVLLGLYLAAAALRALRS